MFTEMQFGEKKKRGGGGKDKTISKTTNTEHGVLNNIISNSMYFVALCTTVSL